MIAIIDYGVGNIFSLLSSLKYIGADAILTSDKKVIESADKILLPGVGAFGDAALKLKSTGMWDIIKDEVSKKNKPLLGICLGMQLLLEKGFEYGEHEGLGFIKGSVVPMEPVIPKNFKIPHIGWNSLHFPEDKEKSKIYKYINENDFVYFVHSFFGTDCNEAVTATTNYGADLTASIEFENVYGTQFHPEKSGETGLKILKGFCEL